MKPASVYPLERGCESLNYEEFTYEDFLTSRIPYLEVLSPDNGLTPKQAEILMEQQAQKCGLSQSQFRGILRDVRIEYERKEHNAKLSELGDYDPEQFCNEKGIVHAKIVDCILENLSILNLSGTLYGYFGGCYIKAEDKLSWIIDRMMPERYRRARTNKEIKELLKIEAPKKSIDDMNVAPRGMICFRDCMFNAKTLERFPHSEEYLCTNQIPHNAPSETAPQDGITKAWLCQAVPDAADREVLLAFAGLCLSPDRSFQTSLFLVGDGGNGKGVFLENVTCAVGKDNVSNKPLEKLCSSRFASAGLVGKIANICGDLSVTALPETSEFKRVTGEDYLDAEEKGKDAFSFRPYAKFLWSLNGLPIVRDDKSGAFARRLRIIKFAYKPKVEDAELKQKLSGDIEWFIWHSVRALHRAYNTADGKFTNSPNSIVLVREMEKDSDTVKAWLYDCIDTDYKPDGKPSFRRQEWHEKYVSYCEKTDRMPCKQTEFYKRMKKYEKKSNGYYYYPSIRWKPDSEYPIISL